MASLSYHVSVEDSKELRRIILETSRDMINLMKRYEQLKNIRIEKIQKFIEMTKLIKEINMISVSLSRKLPLPSKLSNIDTGYSKPTHKIESIKLNTSQNISINNKHLLSSLEDQLNHIGRKLDNL